MCVDGNLRPQLSRLQILPKLSQAQKAQSPGNAKEETSLAVMERCESNLEDFGSHGPNKYKLIGSKPLPDVVTISSSLPQSVVARLRLNNGNSFGLELCGNG